MKTAILSHMQSHTIGQAEGEIQTGPHRLVSLLTREAVEELGLEVGRQATARVKSTGVPIDRV